MKHLQTSIHEIETAAELEQIINENENVIYKSEFLAINVDQIVWILPAEEMVEK